MIKIKLNDVVNATDTFTKIMQQSFKGSLAFKIARLARELDKEMQTFNNERQKIIDKYGEKDANGNLITGENGIVKFSPNTTADLNEEFNTNPPTLCGRVIFFKIFYTHHKKVLHKLTNLSFYKGYH